MTERSLSGIFITGTDTGVGKTYVAAALARLLSRSGRRLSVRKPVESGCAPGDEGLVPADATNLRAAAGQREPLEQVCRFRFPDPVAPDRAARAVGTTLTIDQLVKAAQPDRGADYILVEGAGGFYSPLAEDGLNADLAACLDLPVLLVADDRLGCLNHILLTLEAIRHRGLHCPAVILNRRAEADTGTDNAADLQRWTDRPIHTLGPDDGPETLTGLLSVLLTLRP